MSFSVRLIKALRSVLMLLFLAFLLWIYAYLPEDVIIGVSSGEADFGISISSDQFFYSFLIIFVGINALLMIYFNLVVEGNIHSIPSLFNRTERGRHQFIYWVGALHIVLVIFILTSMLHYGLNNILDNTQYDSEWILLVGPLLLFGILLVLFYLILIHLRKP